MSLVEEYRRQFLWRDWQCAMSRCPMASGQSILDLGCGPGDIAGMLAARGLLVTGIDGSAEMIAAAQDKHRNCRFAQQDLWRLKLPLQSFDALWCSFTAAYFTDFREIFRQWCSFLRPEAWVCVVEIDDLLGHEPLSAQTRARIESYYSKALEEQRYDFKAGGKLAQTIQSAGFTCRVTELFDRELAFAGPATAEVHEAWRARLARMEGLKQYLGAETAAFETEFLECLTSEAHRSRSRVMCCVGTRKHRGQSVSPL